MVVALDMRRNVIWRVTSIDIVLDIRRSALDKFYFKITLFISRDVITLYILRSNLEYSKKDLNHRIRLRPQILNCK